MIKLQKSYYLRVEVYHNFFHCILISMLAFSMLQNLISLHLEITSKFHQQNFPSQMTKTSRQSNGTQFKFSMLKGYTCKA